MGAKLKSHRLSKPMLRQFLLVLWRKLYFKGGLDKRVLQYGSRSLGRNKRREFEADLKAVLQGGPEKTFSKKSLGIVLDREQRRALSRILTHFELPAASSIPAEHGGDDVSGSWQDYFGSGRAKK